MQSQTCIDNIRKSIYNAGMIFAKANNLNVGVNKLKIYSKKVSVLMAKRLWTQKALAEAAGTNRVTINNALLKGSCSIQTAGKIAKALGVDPIDIIED